MEKQLIGIVIVGLLLAVGLSGFLEQTDDNNESNSNGYRKMEFLFNSDGTIDYGRM